jgi:outer membrane protein assembly factor BamA
MEVDDANREISLEVEVQEGKRFRIGRITVLSADRKMQPFLESKFKPGDVFDSQAIEEFFKETSLCYPQTPRQKI